MPAQKAASSVSLRAYVPADAEAFRLLNEAWITQLFKLEPEDLETLLHPDAHILAPGGCIVVAERDGRVIGCGALILMEPGVFEVAKMAVAESERGQGIGRLVLLGLIDEAKALGAAQLYLETNSSLKNAIHLYESAGFRHLAAGEVTPSPYERADTFMKLMLAPIEVQNAQDERIDLSCA